VQECGLSADDELAFSCEPEHSLLARALIATDRPAQACRLLERLSGAAIAGGRAGRAIEMFCLRALALQAQGETGQALACLESALALAEPEGYVRYFVDEGQPMMALLRRAAARDIAPAFLRKLLAPLVAPALVAPAFLAPAHEAPSQPLLDPLSERELDVLRLLATSLSSTEIARELTIAVSTVRSHTKSIYDKLNVHRRLDAVERAKELHLI
jgi:LuxR family maltose regulon positive regulatory protein